MCIYIHGHCSENVSSRHLKPIDHWQVSVYHVHGGYDKVCGKKLRDSIHTLAW